MEIHNLEATVCWALFMMGLADVLALCAQDLSPGMYLIDQHRHVPLNEP